MILTNTRFLIRQGLFFYNNTLYESTGLEGKSKLIKYQFVSNSIQILHSTSLSKSYFGEGSDFAEIDGRVYFFELTWQNRVMCFKKSKVRRSNADC